MILFFCSELNLTDKECLILLGPKVESQTFVSFSAGDGFDYRLGRINTSYNQLTTEAALFCVAWHK